MKQLQFRILAVFITVFAVFSFFFGIFSTNLIQDYSSENQRAALLNQANLIRSFLNGGDTEENAVTLLNDGLREVADRMEERITLIAPDGEVTFDSEADVEQLENHSNREEIQAVLSGEATGISIRESASTNQRLYYVAVPVTDQTGELVGVLRLSKPIAEIYQLNEQIRNSLIVFIVLALILATVITIILARRVAKPIGEIVNVANDLTEKKYSSRYVGKGYGEIIILGESINRLAESLQEQMNEIAQNDNRLNELINHLVIGVMLLDEERNIKMTNPAMSRILEKELTGMVGTSYVEVINSYGLSHMVEEAYRKKAAQNNEVYFYSPENKVVDANIVPIAGKNSREMNLIVLLYDITEIRRLEKVRTDFVANVSHELRTPVTALKGFSETLLDGAMEDKEVLKQFLEIMQAESTRLALLVNDILDLSKLEQKQIPMNRDKINVAEAVEDTFRLVKQKADQKKIELKIQNEEEVILEGDSGRLKQILANLVNNAVVYTQSGGKVEVTVRQEAREAVIIVSDNGMGIPEDEQDRVFERFYRVDKARSRNSGGTGLGLSIVKYLVENFNGTITVSSKLGLGSQFTVKLPLQPS